MLTYTCVTGIIHVDDVWLRDTLARKHSVRWTEHSRRKMNAVVPSVTWTTMIVYCLKSSSVPHAAVIRKWVFSSSFGRYPHRISTPSFCNFRHPIYRYSEIKDRSPFSLSADCHLGVTLCIYWRNVLKILRPKPCYCYVGEDTLSKYHVGTLFFHIYCNSNAVHRSSCALSSGASSAYQISDHIT
jgi:hypothetical protein